MPENPLNTEDAKIANQTVRTLRILISNAQLYSPKSHLVQDGIKRLKLILDPFLKTKGKLTLSESEKNLLICGQLLKANDKSGSAFIENMLQCEIRSLTFNNGIREEELFALIENMSIKKKELRPDLAALLLEKGFTNIEVNKKVYVAMGSNQELGQVEVRDSQSQKGESKEGAGGGDPAQPVTKYSWETPKKAEIPSDSYSAEKTAALAQLALSGSNKDLLSKEKKQSLQRMLKELDGMNRVELTGRLVDKLSENLNDKEKSVRLEAVRSFKELDPEIEQLSDKKIIYGLEEKYIKTEEIETEEEVYRELAELLEKSANRNANQGNYERALQIAGLFRQHKFAEKEGFKNRAQRAGEILEKLANSGLIDILITDLRSPDEKKRGDAFKVVASLDEYAVYYFIKILKDIEDLHLRRIIAFLIKNLGEKAIKMLCQSLIPSLRTEESLRIVEVLDGVEHYDIVFDELKKIYMHCKLELQKAVLNVLAKIKPDRVKEVLVLALEDEDPMIVKEAVRLAGRAGVSELVSRLLSFIPLQSIFSKNTEDVDLEEEVCVALGKIKDPSAIQILAKISEGNGFFSFTRTKNISTRMAALYALGGYTETETKLLLSGFAKNRDKAVSKAATEALKMQEKDLQSEGASEAKRLL